MQRRINFLATDAQSAINSYGEFFNVGDTVSHEDKDAGIATITGFELDAENNEVKVITTKGWVHLDFVVKANVLQSASQLKLDDVTAVMIVNHSSPRLLPNGHLEFGIAYSHYEVQACEINLQDNKTTLKIFI